MPERELRIRPQLEYGYHGHAAKSMHLNLHTAEGFMHSADIRKGIWILALTTQSGIEEHGTHVVGIDGKGWILAINGMRVKDAVEDEIRDKKVPGNKFNTRFATVFQGAVVRGLREILIKEKLFNGLQLTPWTVINYADIALLMPILTEGLKTISEQHGSPEAALLELLAGICGNSIVINALSHFELRSKQNQWKREAANGNLIAAKSLYGPVEPFVRTSLKGFPLPPVPVDRLVRGLVYLQRHGKKLIELQT